MATDDSGNVYITGWTESDSGIATKGAYKTSGDSINGDAFLAKFSPSGKLLWATYYGGNYQDISLSVATDIFGNVYITGWTLSTSGIATSGAYQTSLDDTVDAFLAKFSSSGSLLWGTYFGGNRDDYGYGVASDISGNVYLSGATSSTSGIATSGAYQTIYGGGLYDAFLAKFSSSGSLLWGTYYGGNKEDGVYNLATDTSSNVIITGLTYSTSGIATSGAYQTEGDSVNGKTFLAKFSPTGKIIWSTYYGGNEYSLGYAVATDMSSNIYIIGETNSTSGIATTDAYQAFGDTINNEGYLAKFSSSGVICWGTYFGGDTGNRGFFTTGILGIATDKMGNIFLTGSTSSTLGITTFGTYQSKYEASDYEAFLVKFNTSGNLLWGSYFGNDDDAGANVSIDNSGNVYIYGIANEANNLATSGAYQTMNFKDADAFLARFSIPTYYNDAGISSIINPKRAICADLIPVKVTLKNYGSDTLRAVKILCSINDTIRLNYTWTGSLVSGNSTNVSIGKFSFQPAVDTLKIWTEPIGFVDTVPGNDTAMIVDSIIKSPDAYFTFKSSLDTVKFTPVNNSYIDYSWSFGDGGSSNLVNPSHVYDGNGTYTVSLTVRAANGCSAMYETKDTVGLTGIASAPGNNLSLQIYPNPFTNQTTISGVLNENSAISLAIYDMTGRMVVEKSGERGARERFEYIFDADRYGCGSGVFIVKIMAGNEVITREIVRIR